MAAIQMAELVCIARLPAVMKNTNSNVFINRRSFRMRGQSSIRPESAPTMRQIGIAVSNGVTSTP